MARCPFLHREVKRYDTVFLALGAVMRRREFLSIAGGVAAWPLAAGAQQSRSVRNVAVIMGFAESDPVWQSYLATFRQRLDDFGWHDGRDVQFKYWFTGESNERTRAAATEAVAAKPDRPCNR
jgi:putative tryptophan/tyrosine transport system substrate-binding protein